MAISFVGVYNNVVAGNSLSFTKTYTANNLLIAVVGADIPSANLSSSTSNPSWTAVQSQNSGNSTGTLHCIRILAQIATGSSQTQTFAGSGATANVITAQIYEFSGLGTTNLTNIISAIKRASNNSGNSTTDFLVAPDPLPSSLAKQSVIALTAIWWYGGETLTNITYDNYSDTQVAVYSNVGGIARMGVLRDIDYTTPLIYDGYIHFGYWYWTNLKYAIGSTVVIPEYSNVYMSFQEVNTVFDLTSLNFNPMFLVSSESVTVTDRPNYYEDMVYIGENIVIYISPKKSEFFIWFG